MMRSLGSLLLIVIVMAACEPAEPPDHQRVIGGDPRLGRTVVAAYGCNACHDIPGIGQVIGTVGPSLVDFGERAYIAGRLPNRPAMLTSWLRDPPAIDPATAMPALGLSQSEARHVAAFLYTLR